MPPPPIWPGEKRGEVQQGGTTGGAWLSPSPEQSAIGPVLCVLQVVSHSKRRGLSDGGYRLRTCTIAGGLTMSAANAGYGVPIRVLNAAKLAPGPNAGDNLETCEDWPWLRNV